MASWEDYEDNPELIPDASASSKVSEPAKAKAGQGAAESPVQAWSGSAAPPKPTTRGGMSESANISQAYMASQPKMRILQRAPPANPASRGASPAQTNADSDESVARLHANLEAKQRNYEAARKKLFDEGQAVEESS